ncbi:hypothetical protein D3C72_200330 [compost metagenome]
MIRIPRVGSALAALAATLMALSLPLPAQASGNARSAGMAGAMAAFSTDADAMIVNPAMLGLAAHRDRLSLTLLPNLSAALGNNVLSFGELANVLSTQTVAAADVARAVEALPPTGWRFLMDGGTTMALAMPSARTGVFLHAMADTKGFDVPRDLVALVLNGNASVPNVGIDTMTGATATAVASLGSAFAVPLGETASLGMNLRYLRGLAYGRVREAKGTLLAMDASGRYSADARLEAEWATGGNGIAADLGVAGTLGDRLRWGAVLGNVGVMAWSQRDLVTYTLKVEPFTIVDASGSATDFGAVTRDAVQESRRQEGPTEIALPAYLRLAAAFNPWDPLTLTSELQLGYGDGFGVSSTPEMRLGSELRLLDWLPIRGGIALGGDRGLTFATGLGLDMPHFRLDFAMAALNGVGGYARGASYTLSNTVKF